MRHGLNNQKYFIHSFYILEDKNYELETMHKINPALRTRQTILATQVVYDIPEEESEWNDEEHDHFVTMLAFLNSFFH